MSESRSRRIERLFLELCDLLPEEWEPRLKEACPDDQTLQLEVLSLLREDRSTAGFLAVREAGPEARLAELLKRMPPETPPREIGAYRILGILGRGAMGIVYEAEQARPQRRVALKVLAAGVDSARDLRRFEREAEILGRLHHPGIAQIHEAGVFENEGRSQPFLVLELVDGLSLTRWADERKLRLVERLELFVRVCAGVQHAHQQGVIHRDLKPSNILVTELGQPKILDFGIARSLGPGALQTLEGAAVIGTLAYMSPEQAEGKTAELDTRTDIHALGVILHELLTGRLPYEVRGKAIHVALQILIGQEPHRLREHNSRLRGDLDHIVAKALEKDPDRRYSSAQALAEDVERYLRGEPILARPSTTIYQLRKWIARNRTLSGGVAGTFLSLLGGLIVALILKNQSDRNAVQAAERSREVLRLSALQELDDLTAEADLLWPAHQENVDKYVNWLSRARALMDERPQHESKLVELRPRAESSSDVARAGTTTGPPRTVTAIELGGTEEKWWRNQLEKLLAGLQEFGHPARGLLSEGASPEHGWGVEKRLEFARTIEARSVSGAEAAARWAEAIASIDDPAQCPLYDGLEIPPQMGLVPIGRDPVSGLWEFVHLQTGEAPVRNSNGELVLTEECGLVFVLIPGGSFLPGAQSKDPYVPNYYEDSAGRIAQPDEAPPSHPIALDPFFLSKYEMNQAQWERSNHVNPSEHRAGKPYGAVPISALHPVERVSWSDCFLTLQRLDLSLPTEVQWEYAARAGTTTPWWTGAGAESLEGAANLADRSAQRSEAYFAEFLDWLDDGFPVTAPVNALQPNPVGLFHVHGNVWEWCRDREGPHELCKTNGDGERENPTGLDHVSRGGGCDSSDFLSRASFRYYAGSDNADAFTGVRPSRAIDGLEGS